MALPGIYLQSKYLFFQPRQRKRKKNPFKFLKDLKGWEGKAEEYVWDELDNWILVTLKYGKFIIYFQGKQNAACPTKAETIKVNDSQWGPRFYFFYLGISNLF